MSALSESPAAVRRSDWLLMSTLTVGVLLVLVGMFWPTVLIMVRLWGSSDTFAHGYLIFPISVWLLWRQRAELMGIQPRPDLAGLVLLAAAGAGWLLADAGSVNVVAQYAFICMLIATIWTLLGRAFVRLAFFPLMFLFFAVPVGEFLIQPLMNLTADFTVAMLQLTGIPVYREGTFFSIPSGDWSVVEACSGLRYLIASFTLGVLYAYLTYRTWSRRLLFSIAALIVPILANSGRAYMIVMIGHLFGAEHASGVDHLIYGWVFFGFVMLLLFWVGGFWREDDQPAPGQSRLGDVVSKGRARLVLPTAVAVLLVAGMWPAYANWLNKRPLPALPDLQVESTAGWQPAATLISWDPHWSGSDRQLRRSYAQAGRHVLLALDYYATQRQGAELVSSQNFMIQEKDPQWANVGERIANVEIGGQVRQVRQAKLRGRDGKRLLVWQWNLINQQPIVSDHKAKLMLALDRVRMRRDDGLSVLIATFYDETELEAATATLARFAADMEPAIGHTLDQVDGQ